MLGVAIFSALTGAVLAQRFKIMILIPATASIIGATTVAGVVHADPFWWILLMAAAASAGTQLGYIFGLGIRHFFEAPLAQRPARLRPNGPATRHSVH